MDNIKDVENLSKLKNKFDDEISKIIIGQQEVINQIFIALLSNSCELALLKLSSFSQI